MPDDISSPEYEEVVVDVPVVDKEMARLTSPEEPPPVKPAPAETAVISPLEPVESVDEMVMVVPEVETEVAPEP